MSWFALGSALWLGVLTSISPCPLATNIAAISFVGRRADKTREVFLSGLLYTLGRTAAYVALAVLVIMGLTATSDVSRFLQKYMNQILGPVLILVGMLLLNLISFTGSMNLAGGGIQERAAKGGRAWSLILGILFALSFCPVSAGLFFGALVPLSVKAGSWVLLPTVYGVGTAVPVFGFAFLIAFAAQRVGRAFERLTQVERWIRFTVGVLFIVVGVYYCLAYIYDLRILSFTSGSAL